MSSTPGHALVLEQLHEIAVHADRIHVLLLVEMAAGLDAVRLAEILDLLHEVGRKQVRAIPEQRVARRRGLGPMSYHRAG